jgi:hypothetical protein
LSRRLFFTAYLLKLALDDGFFKYLRLHCQECGGDHLQRPEFSGVDRLTILLLEAEQEELSVLKITSDVHPSKITPGREHPG